MIGLFLLLSVIVGMAWALNTPRIHRRLLRGYAKIYTASEGQPYPLTETVLQDIEEHQGILVHGWNEVGEQARLCLFALEKARAETGRRHEAAERLFNRSLRDLKRSVRQVRSALDTLLGYDPSEQDFQAMQKGSDLSLEVLGECEAGTRAWRDGLERIEGFFEAVEVEGQ